MERVIDNIFAKRLWRSLNYEEAYLNDYETVQDAEDGIKHYYIITTSYANTSTTDIERKGRLTSQGTLKRLTRKEQG